MVLKVFMLYTFILRKNISLKITVSVTVKIRFKIKVVVKYTVINIEQQKLFFRCVLSHKNA